MQKWPLGYPICKFTIWWHWFIASTIHIGFVRPSRYSCTNETKQLIKPAPDWITDEYRTAKCMRRQYEHAWRRDKSPVYWTCLRRQIYRRNHILNKNNGRFYHDLVSENCGDGKKLWEALNRFNRILSQSNATVLPSFVDEKSLGNRFGLFFIDKIKRIKDTFKHTPSKSLPEKEPPTFSSFQGVTESEVLKFIKEAPLKTCSLDPCPTHIVKKCIDILLPSLTKLSLKKGIFPNPFKKAMVTPLLKNLLFQESLSFLSKLVEHIVAAQIRSHMGSHDVGNTFQSVYKAGTQQKLPCASKWDSLISVQGHAYSTGAARLICSLRYYQSWHTPFLFVS